MKVESIPTRLVPGAGWMSRRVRGSSLGGIGGSLDALASGLGSGRGLGASVWGEQLVVNPISAPVVRAMRGRFIEDPFWLESRAIVEPLTTLRVCRSRSWPRPCVRAGALVLR